MTSPMPYWPHYTGEFQKQFFLEKSVNCECGETLQTHEHIVRDLLPLQRSVGNPTGDKPWTSIARTPGNPQRHSCPHQLPQRFRCLHIHWGEIHAQRNTCLWRWTRTTWHRLGGWPFQQWTLNSCLPHLQSPHPGCHSAPSSPSALAQPFLTPGLPDPAPNPPHFLFLAALQHTPIITLWITH